MYAPKVQLKVFSSVAADVAAYIPVFHRWIREDVLKELVIDVVDYSHVENGPEVVLIGHASDYALDRAGGKLGLLYASKREAEREGGAFLEALRRAFRVALLLEKEQGPSPAFAFGSSALEFRIADRLHAPNDDETLAAVRPALEEALGRVYGSTPFTLTRSGSARELFTVEVRAEGAAPIAELLARIA